MDSEWIPFLYSRTQGISRYPVEPTALNYVLSQLEGTFGTWLYDINSNDILVARADNTIFWNQKKTAFSSKACGDINILMEDNSIYYKKTNEDNFNIDSLKIKHKSKYFIPE